MCIRDRGGAVPDDEQIHNLLEKKTAGGELTEQENALLNIFCTAAELDRANASAKMNTTVKDRISADLQEMCIRDRPGYFLPCMDRH